MAASQVQWVVVPSSHKELLEVQRRCRQIVTRRALMAAGAAALPMPGLDIAADVGLVTRLLHEINREFGLTPAQILRLSPRRQTLAYQAIVAVGTAVVGKLVTREVVWHSLRAVGVRITAKQATKVVPVAGQAVSAVLGFAALRFIGLRHIEDCSRVAERLLELPDSR
jgi:uncharacterized protein (DUF697 family)